MQGLLAGDDGVSRYQRESLQSFVVRELTWTTERRGRTAVRWYDRAIRGRMISYSIPQTSKFATGTSDNQYRRLAYPLL
jgi:hypothetical protein